MKAVVLCGGQGTRIRDANELVPKPLLPIGGKPIVWHIMKGYSAHGVQDFVVCCGYKGYVVKEFFANLVRHNRDPESRGPVLRKPYRPAELRRALLALLDAVN